MQGLHASGGSSSSSNDIAGASAAASAKDDVASVCTHFEDGHCGDEVETSHFVSSLQDLLTKQLATVHQALVAAEERLQHPIASRQEAVRRLESKLRELRSENTRLRTCISSSSGEFSMYTQSGGTGESCGASEVKSRGGPRAFCAGPAVTAQAPLPNETPPCLAVQWVDPVPVPQQPAAFAAPAPQDHAPEMALPGCSDVVTLESLESVESLSRQQDAEEPMILQDVHTDAKITPRSEPDAVNRVVSLHDPPPMMNRGFGQREGVLPGTVRSHSRPPSQSLDKKHTDGSEGNGAIDVVTWSTSIEAVSDHGHSLEDQASSVVPTSPSRPPKKSMDDRNHSDSHQSLTVPRASLSSNTPGPIFGKIPTNKSTTSRSAHPALRGHGASHVSHASLEMDSSTILEVAGETTTEGENGHFKLLPIWRDEARRQQRSGARSQKGQKSIMRLASKGVNKLLGSENAVNDSVNMDSQAGNSRIRCSVIHPNTVSRGTWDILSLFLVIYDMGSIPLQFFEPPESIVGNAMEWVTRLFWTLDICASFTTGYVTMNGFIEMRWGKVARRYLRTWFLLDVCIVGIDWVEVALKQGADGGAGYARIGKASRTFRIVRMVRLLRLVRMREVFALITERFNSEKVVIIADITKLIVIILGLAHLIGCSWYGIGASDPEDSDNWVVQHGYARKELSEKYAMSLHWSLSQFAGGMDEVTPQKLAERLFAIVVFVLAFIIAALFVSSLTSSMTQLNIIGSEQSKKLSVLGKYLAQNGITNKLAMRVKRNAQQAVLEQQRLLPENAVQLLSMVSEPLRVEIHLEMYSPHFNVHPFFRAYVEECPMVMRKVCHLATSILQVTTGDVIFSTGEIPALPKMYIVCSGLLTYHRVNGEDFDVSEGYWISEAALWTTWVHRGLLVASDDCRLFELDAKKFQDIASQFEHSDFCPIDYAVEFVNALNDSEVVPHDLPFGVYSNINRDGKRTTIFAEWAGNSKETGRTAKILPQGISNCIEYMQNVFQGLFTYGRKNMRKHPAHSRSHQSHHWLQEMMEFKKDSSLERPRPSRMMG